MSTASYHTPVLLREVLMLLAPMPGETIVDATLGGGGHAEAVLERISPRGLCVGIDADADALAAAGKRLERFGKQFIPVQDNFGNLASALSRISVTGIDGILFDLGISSRQIDDPSKGFTFREDDILDMRLDRRQMLSARDIVNSYSAQQLEQVFRMFGEERYSRKIARAIVGRRERQSIRTTGELASIIEQSVRGPFRVKSLARVFQAIRIEVNNELDQLRRGLEQAHAVVASGGRMVVISYHSLEDRIVKDFFREGSKTVVRSGVKYVPDATVTPTLTLLTRKPVVASREEIRENPRARSAKLRAALKL